MRKSKKRLVVSLLASIAMLSAMALSAVSVSAATENGFTVGDATKIQKYLVGMKQLSDDELTRYDVNKDGVVTIDDATKIQQKLANFDKMYSVEPTEPTATNVVE